MFPLQKITSFLVIELIRIPFNKRKIRAVMVGMAANTFLAGIGRDAIGGMQSAFGHNPRANVGMATNAFELWLPATNLVAIRAVHSAIEKLMLPRERTGRNLRRCRSSKHTQQKQSRKGEDKAKLWRGCEREAQPGRSKINLFGTALFFVSSKIPQTSFAPQGMVRRFAPAPLPTSKSIRALVHRNSHRKGTASRNFICARRRSPCGCDFRHSADVQHHSI